MNTALLAALIGQQNADAIALIRVALGSALPVDMQVFASTNWRDLARWVSCEDGRIAIQTFIGDWRANCKSGTIAQTPPPKEIAK